MEYLRDFLIGASFLIWFPILHISLNMTNIINNIPHTWFKSPEKIGMKYFRGIQNFENTEIIYFIWLILMSIWFGLWNIISLIIAKKYKLSKPTRFFVIAIISSQIQVLLAYYFQVYELTSKEWIRYSLSRALAYLFMWMIVFYNLDKYYK